MTILDDIAKYKREEIAAAKARLSDAALDEPALLALGRALGAHQGAVDVHDPVAELLDRDRIASTAAPRTPLVPLGVLFRHATHGASNGVPEWGMVGYRALPARAWA